MVASTFSDELAYALVRDEIKHLLGNQGVVNDGITALKQAVRLNRQQLRIPWSGSHQINGSNQRLIHGSADNRSISPSRSKGRSSNGAVTEGGVISSDILFGARTNGNGLASGWRAL